MNRLKGNGTVDCHDTEIRKMALQINHKSFWLLSAGRDMQVAIAAGLRGDQLRSSWCQEGLSCSYTRAKCHRREESRRDRVILRGDTSSTAGKRRLEK